MPRRGDFLLLTGKALFRLGRFRLLTRRGELKSGRKATESRILSTATDSGSTSQGWAPLLMVWRIICQHRGFMGFTGLESVTLPRRP